MYKVSVIGQISHDKNTKKKNAFWGFYHLGSLGIYFDKMDPNFEKKMTRSAPLGVPTVILLGFVSDFHTLLTICLVKQRFFGVDPSYKVCIYMIYTSQSNCNNDITQLFSDFLPFWPYDASLPATYLADVRSNST